MAQPFVLDVNLRIQQVLGLDKVKQQLAGIQVGGVGQVDKLSTGLKNVGTTAGFAGLSLVKTTKNTVALGRSAAKTGKHMQNASKQAKNFGDSVLIAGKRYGAFLAATTAAFKAVQLIGAGTKSVIEFDQAMVSLSQILDVSVDQLGSLSQQFLDLSIATGTSAAEISNAAKLLAQAGFRGNDLTEAVEQLAKVPLTPIFEGMDQAVDGVIAVMRQFGDEGLTVEQVFDKLINVSNAYAASMPDIIEGVKRGGAAFSAMGGTFDEFIGAFTTIRSVTRESSSAVGTSIKTITARLADPKFTAFLKGKGIRIFEKDQFIGPLQVIRKIGNELERLGPTSKKALEIAIKIGGKRQISRFITLAKNIELTDEIINKSTNSFDTFNRVADQGLKAVGKQIDILVNKSKKLAIELGEGLFIPFIQGLTGAGDAAIGLLNALKPILPLMAKIGAVVAGAAIFRGVGGFLGPKLGQLAGPAAFAAAGGGMKGAGAGLAASPFMQAGLLIAAAEVAASFTQAADGTKSFTGTLITSIAAISAAIALFRQQTIAQFAVGGGLFPSFAKLGKIGGLAGTAATVGALAIPLAAQQATKSAQELSDKILNSAIQSIATIEIDPIDPRSLEKGLGDLYQTIGQSVHELIGTADVLDDPSIAKTFQGIGRAWANVFEGDYEAIIRSGGLTQRNVENHIQKALKKNPKLIDNFMESVANSIATGGDIIARRPGVERRKLIAAGVEQGIPIKEIGQFADAIIESAGGLGVWTNKIQENVEILQKEKEKRERLLALTQVFIPPQLVGQLLQFSKAVDKTARAISVSARLFETQIAEIEGGIKAPTLEFDFGAQQVEQLIRTGGLKEVFEFTPDIPRFIGGLSEVESLLDQFIINISNLPTDVDLTTEIDKFFDFQQDVPKAIRDNFDSFFRTIAEDIRLASEGKLIDASEIKDRFEKEFAGLGFAASDAAVETISKFLNNMFARMQDELNRLATVRRFELAAPVRIETQVAFLEQQLERIGVVAAGSRGTTGPMGTVEELELRRRERAAMMGVDPNRQRLPTPDPDFFKGRGQRLADIAGDERVRQQVRDSFQQLTLALSDSRKELAELKPGAKGFIEASERAKELARKMIELQTALAALDKGAQQALASEMESLKERQKFELIQKRISLERRPGIDPTVSQRAVFDLQQKHIQEQIALQDKYDGIVEKDNMLRTNLAQEISKTTITQGEVVQKFDASVGVFRTATDSLNQNIISFGQAVIDFKNLGVDAQPLGATNNVQITTEQIRSGGVTIQQAYDEFNRLLNNVDNSGQEQIDILNAIYGRQEQVQPTKQESSVTQKEQERGTEANEKISKLTESLENLRTLLAEPNELKLITDQRIDLDLSTLPLDISEEIRPVLEEAAMLVAKTVTRKALESLAAKSDSELSIAATDVAQELI